MKRLSALLVTLASIAVLAAWGIPRAFTPRGGALAARAAAGGGGAVGRSGQGARRVNDLGLYAPIPGSRIDMKEAASLANLGAPGAKDAKASDLADEAAGEAAEPRSERPISPAEEARLHEIAKHLPPSDRVQQMGRSAKDFFLGSNLQVEAFADAIDGRDVCRTPSGAPCNVVPPDTQMAVGPNHLVTVVNVAIEIFDKSAHLLSGPTYFRNFFAGVPGCSPRYFDPNVLYDEAADRYFIGIDVRGEGYCLAASATGDPTGAWNRYFIPIVTLPDFFDYPQAGVGRDAIYLGGTNFLADGSTTGPVFAIRKDELYAGTPITVATGVLGAENVPQPANLHGFQQGTWPRVGPHYIITDDVYDGRTYGVWTWSNPFGGGQLTKEGVLDLNAATGVVAGLPPAMPQSGGDDLYPNDFRSMDLEYRNGFYWTTNTIACNPGTGTVECTRWAVFEPHSLHVLDAGVVASNDVHRGYGDLAVDACGNMALGYSIASASTTPGIAVAGRRFFDPRGKLRPEQLVLAGQQTYTATDPPPHRWGDYGELTIDPNGRDFYFFNEYAKAIDYPNQSFGTYISKLSFGCPF
jgi:hypothetical protein